MKQALQLRLGQQLAMTTQLLQAIKLLQMSGLDLQQEIQQALDSNMMLETAEEEGHAPAEAHDLSEPEPEYRELGDMDAAGDIPQELAVDFSWDEAYDSLQSFSPSSADNDDFLLQRAPAQTLHDLLMWQMKLTNFSERDYAIATAIIDAIDDDGYLTAALEDIHQELSSQIPGLESDEVQAVLRRVQNFDPPGVAALDLADCLRIQLNQLPDATPWKPQALRLVTQHLDLLAKKDLARLKRCLGIDDKDLPSIVALIRSLDPKPGSRVNANEPQHIVPDVFVVRQNYSGPRKSDSNLSYGSGSGKRVNEP